jgi:hypothetical protein
MPWDILRTLLLVVLPLVLGVLIPRLRYGRRLLRIGETPSGTRLNLPAALALVWIVIILVTQRFWLGLPLGLLLLLLALRFAPPPAGSWVLYENGIYCAEGPKPEFMRWQDLDGFEWNGDTILVHRGLTLLGGASGSHALEVPADRRSELEAILATRLRQGT